VPQSLTVRAKGLYLTGSDLSAPDGALAQADDVVISREGVVETRRGMEVRAEKALARLFGFKEAIVGHDGTSTLSRSSDQGATWTDYGAAVTPPSGYPVRAVEAASSLFVTDQVRPKRLDSLTATPEETGVPGALDVELTLSSAGSPTAMPTDTQLAYRVVFGKKDANQRLLLGAPSSRGVIANTAGATRDVTVAFSLPRGLDSSHFVQAYRTTSSVDATTDAGDEMGLVYEAPVPQSRTVSQLVRATNVVTATSTAHGYSTGMIVRVSPCGVSGSFAGVASDYAHVSLDGAAWTAYALPASGFAGVAWNGSVLAAVGSDGFATSPDGQTWTSRTKPTGSFSAVTWTGSVFVAVGTDVAATSPDGITWTSRTIPAGAYLEVVWNGTVLVAVGSGSAAATSPDGVTWTARTIPTGTYLGLTWSGSSFVAVGSSVAATSPDGAAWTARTIPAGTYYGAASNGSIVVAVGSVSAYSANQGASWSAASTPGGTYYASAWNGTTFAAAGVSSATSADGTAWSAATGGAFMQSMVATGTVFSPGEKTIASVPTADTFTYAETGANGTLAQSQTAEPLTGAFLDTVPDAFLGAALYTNANQEGILAANDRPPMAREMAHFGGSLFLGHITLPASGTAYLLAVSGSNGLAVNDTVTINGVAYTAKSAESISAREFKLYTTGTVSQNIRDTSASLLRVVNRSLSSGATVVDISDPEGVPGYLEFRNTAPTGNLTVAFSRTTAWSPTSISESPKTHKNGLVWSKQDQPDHFPRSLTLLPVKVGSDDKTILRILPTRSAAFVIKEDGLWRVTGGAGVFDVQPFDPTIRVIGAETAVQLDNTIFALSEQGVVRISDTGVAVVSRPIESALLALLAPAMRSATDSLSFAVGYESDRKYLLWLPSAASDTKATQAYVFDMFTGAWTRRTDDFSHVFVNRTDDRLYGVDGTSVWQERKSLDDTDLADRSYAVTISSGGGTTSVVLASATNAAVGDVLAQGTTYGVITAKVSNTVTLDRAAALTNAAATVYKAIPTVVKWSPKFGGSPMALTELQEIALFWDRVYFARATLTFTTNVSPSPETLTLLGADYGWTGAVVEQAEIRAWPPLEKSWASQFNISLSHAQAWSPNAVAGLGLTFVSRSGMVSR
jgi:hypothetical protein